MKNYCKFLLLLQLLFLIKNVRTHDKNDSAVFEAECSARVLVRYIGHIAKLSAFSLTSQKEDPKTITLLQAKPAVEKICAKYKEPEIKDKSHACTNIELLRKLYFYNTHVFNCMYMTKNPPTFYRDSERYMQFLTLCHRRYCTLGNQIRSLEEDLKFSNVGQPGHCFIETNLFKCYINEYWSLMRPDINRGNCILHDSITRCYRKELEAKGCSYHFLTLGMQKVSSLFNIITRKNNAACPPIYIEHMEKKKRPKDKYAKFEQDGSVAQYPNNELVLGGLICLIYNAL